MVRGRPGGKLFRLANETTFQFNADFSEHRADFPGITLNLDLRAHLAGALTTRDQSKPGANSSMRADE